MPTPTDPPQSGQRLGLVACIAIAGALGLVAYGFQRWAMVAHPDDHTAHLESDDRPSGARTWHELFRKDPAKRQMRIRELTRWQGLNKCNRGHLDEVLELLDLDGQADAAAAMRQQYEACPP